MIMIIVFSYDRVGFLNIKKYVMKDLDNLLQGSKTVWSLLRHILTGPALM